MLGRRMDGDRVVVTSFGFFFCLGWVFGRFCRVCFRVVFFRERETWRVFRGCRWGFVRSFCI